MRPIAEHQSIDRERFEREIVPRGEPAVLRGLVGGWPLVHAAKQGNDALAEFLRAFATDDPFDAWFGDPEFKGRIGYTDDFKGFNHDKRPTTIDALLDLLLRPDANAPSQSIYAGGVPVPQHLPGLLRKIPIAVLEKSRPRMVSLWIGNRSRVAPHWDLLQNLACVVAGRRRFTLFPTDQVANLYVGPLDFTPAGQPISLVDVDAPDLDRYPRFEQALEAAQVAELGPGDVLYIPSLWWHSVASLDQFGAMINFWWSDAQPPLMTPRNALYLAVITMKNLPPKELAAWRSMFDHYVFDDNGDPAAHLPEQARGVLGKRTPELIARVKKLVVGALTR